MLGFVRFSNACFFSLKSQVFSGFPFPVFFLFFLVLSWFSPRPNPHAQGKSRSLEMRNPHFYFRSIYTRRESPLVLCSFCVFASRLYFVSVSSLSHLSLIIRARKVRFCEVLKTDLIFRFFRCQKSGFDRFSNPKFS
jgi:hypothetical protein